MLISHVNNILLLCVIILCSATVSDSFATNDSSNPLLGEWVLDKEVTIKYSIDNNFIDNKYAEAWNRSSTVIEFTDNDMKIKYKSDEVISSYKIVELSDTEVKLSINNSKELFIYYLCDDGFYLLVDSNLREYYKRLNRKHLGSDSMPLS